MINTIINVITGETTTVDDGIEYVAPTPTAQDVRRKRDELIAATDWTGNSDVTMTSAMTTYRTALRNVPAQAGFPNSITWPTLGGS